MSKTNRYFNRWWTTIDGVRVIKNYPLHVDPNVDSPHYWQRGHGPHDPQRLERYRIHMERFIHLPKSEQHRAAMSRAALGVPKSPQHKESMRRAHHLRVQRVRELMSENPDLSYHQASTLEAQSRKTKK